MTSELEAISQALSNGEAEFGTAKFIQMDDDTVYRFENNRMKKVSKTTINKAKKLAAKLAQNQGMGNGEFGDGDEQTTPTSKRTKKQTKKTKRQQIIESDDENENDGEGEGGMMNESIEDDEPIPQPKPRKQTRTKGCRNAIVPDVDLNEYYNMKNKLEYMSQDNERLNQKVKKLRTYKELFNKVSGFEYECNDYMPPMNQSTNQQPQQQVMNQSQAQPQTQTFGYSVNKNGHRDDLFM